MTNEESRKEEIRIMSLPGMQKKFQEAMGHIIHRDSYMFPRSDKVYVHDGHRDKTPLPKYIEIEAIRLPLTIDRDNPERGLLGMVVRCEGIFSCDLEWQPGLIEGDGWRLSLNWYKKIKQYTGDTPLLALLRALQAQWGIEI
jgi:hypothetical protein